LFHPALASLPVPDRRAVLSPARPLADGAAAGGARSGDRADAADDPVPAPHRGAWTGRLDQDRLLGRAVLHPAPAVAGIAGEWARRLPGRSLLSDLSRQRGRDLHG